MAIHIRRREFIFTLGGAAAAWPLAARAQQLGQTRLLSDSWLPTLRLQSQRVAAFVQRLRELAWIDGRNLAIEYRWAEGRNERYAESAAEFVRLKVDVIVTTAPARPRDKAGDIGRPDRLRARGRPGGHRPDPESGATGRQRYRPVDPADRYCRQAPRTIARGCPQSSSVSDYGECQLSRRCDGDERGAGNSSRVQPPCTRHSKSDGRRISRLPSRRSRAAQRHFMWRATRS